jgi:dCMP deaminase
MTTRPSKAETFLRMAIALSEQSTCVRRNVGVIMTDHMHQIIASGYNGVAHGAKHCIDKPCAGACQPSGDGLDMCEAIHAEQNALMQCRDVMKLHSVYCTTSPCVHCVKMLINTNAIHIYYVHAYPGIELVKQRWAQSSVLRKMTQVIL